MAVTSMKFKAAGILFLVLLLLINTIQTFSTESDESLSFSYDEPSDPTWPGVKITLLKNGQPVGFVCTAQINKLLKWYVLYDLFIEKEFRGHHYATVLGKHALQILDNQHARKIYIQAGPFDKDADGDMYIISSKAERTQRLAELMEGYKNKGFTQASPVLRFLAKGIYRMIGIPEDSYYLMVYTPHDGATA